MNKKLKYRYAVRCIETGIVYPSIGAAQNIFSPGSIGIQQALSGYQKRAYGYHWEFVEEDVKKFKNLI